jgi:hypothetical protein
VAIRLPGLRQTLPERVDVLGERQEQRPSTVINPTIGSPAKELGDPVLKAMLENGVSMDFREQGRPRATTPTAAGFTPRASGFAPGWNG